MRISATAAIALIAFGAGAAHAGTVSEVTKELNGRIVVELDRSFEFEGTGGLNLENVRVLGDGTARVDVPEVIDNAVEIDQGNWGNVTAETKIRAVGTENLEVSSTAIANVATVDVPGSLSLEAAQINDGYITATVDLQQNGGSGVTDVTATAIANAITGTTTGLGLFDVSQQNDATVVANLHAGVIGRNIDDVNTAATAIGNVLSLELDGRAIGSISQHNKGNIVALNNSHVNVVRDPATATAIANAISITQAAAQ